MGPGARRVVACFWLEMWGSYCLVCRHLLPAAAAHSCGAQELSERGEVQQDGESHRGQLGLEWGGETLGRPNGLLPPRVDLSEGRDDIVLLWQEQHQLLPRQQAVGLQGVGGE